MSSVRLPAFHSRGNVSGSEKPGCQVVPPIVADRRALRRIDHDRRTLHEPVV